MFGDGSGNLVIGGVYRVIGQADLVAGAGLCFA
jgi:hypothetical protein